MTRQPTTQPGPPTNTDTPPFRYTAAFAGEVETRWQRVWEERAAFCQSNPGDPGFDAARPKFFCLDMFPYPSGAGLHVGHPEGYTATDIISRFRRMKGYNVLHPMGWDAFGLPAEQYAIKTGVHPAITTRSAIDNFRRQLKRLGFSYDWSREFATIDPDYYRWTQWIFLQVYHSWYDPQQRRARPISELVAEYESGAREPRLNPDAAEYAGAGDVPGGTRVGDWATLDESTRRMLIDSWRLAYAGRQTVNWCPKLGTVLANEEVIDGKSERGGFPVFRKPMRQWLFRITAYADRLLDGLDTVDWPASTKTMQAEWIGRSVGAEIDFPLLMDGVPVGVSVRVFTTRPDTMFGATYMVVAPEHPLVDEALSTPSPETDEGALREYVRQARNRSDVERMESRDKTGVFTGLYAQNPATGEPIPIWTSDYVLMGYGTGAIMAVPAQDQRDWDFATKYGLPIVRTVRPPEGFSGEVFTGDGPAMNSGFLDGMSVADAKKAMTTWLEERQIGMKRVNYRLRDWLFSRQRYWGEPFPIVWDEMGNHYGVCESKLPVVLPDMTDYVPEESDDPKPLLAKAQDWIATTAGEAGISELAEHVRLSRESNTMPGWAGSCWYYLRFCDPKNNDRFVSAEAERYWMNGNVDLYIGGAEHAVLHLLYARFWHKVLFDLGHVTTDEPFRKLFHQGLITSYAYEREDRSLVPVDEVDEPSPGTYIERATSKPVRQIVAKMSKALKNVVNPDGVIDQFGADTFRLYEMYMGPLDASKPWNTSDTVGLLRFLQRLWRVLIDEEHGSLKLASDADGGLEKLLHRTTAKVAHDIDALAFNTAIAAMIEFVNAATSNAGDGASLTRDQASRFVRVLAPFAPHMAEELWSRLGYTDLIVHQTWPEVDEAMLVDSEVELAVQIKGKVRARLVVPAAADASQIERLALADSKVIEAIAGAPVRKIIVVPGRLVNIVTG